MGEYIIVSAAATAECITISAAAGGDAPEALLANSQRRAQQLHVRIYVYLFYKLNKVSI